jgi:hypothetical protein
VNDLTRELAEVKQHEENSMSIRRTTKIAHYSHMKHVLALGLLGAAFAGCSAGADFDETGEGDVLGASEQAVSSATSQPLLFGPPCGGLAGLACPTQMRCIDDPSDSCDPRAGGADCMGICICKPRIACAVDADFGNAPCGCMGNGPGRP